MNCLGSICVINLQVKLAELPAEWIMLNYDNEKHCKHEFIEFNGQKITAKSKIPLDSHLYRHLVYNTKSLPSNC